MYVYKIQNTKVTANRPTGLTSPPVPAITSLSVRKNKLDFKIIFFFESTAFQKYSVLKKKN